MDTKIANKYARFVLDVTGITENMNCLVDMAEDKIVGKCGDLDMLNGICYDQIYLKNNGKIQSINNTLTEKQKLNFEKIIRDDDLLLSITREYNGSLLFDFDVNLPLKKYIQSENDFLPLNIQIVVKKGYCKEFDIYGSVDESDIDRAESYFNMFCSLLS